MFLTGAELTRILRDEDDYIQALKAKWLPHVIDEQAERKLRIGKRIELLADLEAAKSKAS